MEANIDGTNELPKLLDSFPNEGRINYSGRYIDKNFLGYRSLSGAFTMEYEVNDTQFKMFLIQKEVTNDCKKVLKDKR